MLNFWVFLQQLLWSTLMRITGSVAVQAWVDSCLSRNSTTLTYGTPWQCCSQATVEQFQSRFGHTQRAFDAVVNLPPTKEEVHVFAVFVCLSVSKIAQKRVHGFGLSTDVGTSINWLTFQPDPDHSLDAGTGLLSPISYRLPNSAALPCQWAALIRVILRREIPRIRAARTCRCFIHWAVGRNLCWR